MASVPASLVRPIVGLILDGRGRIFLFHLDVKTASLNHETINDTMEYRVIVKSTARILEKIGNRQWCLFFVQFDDDIAVGGMQGDHIVVSSGCSSRCSEGGRSRFKLGMANRRMPNSQPQYLELSLLTFKLGGITNFLRCIQKGLWARV